MIIGKCWLLQDDNKAMTNRGQWCYGTGSGAEATWITQALPTLRAIGTPHQTWRYLQHCQGSGTRSLRYLFIWMCSSRTCPATCSPMFPRTSSTRTPTPSLTWSTTGTTTAFNVKRSFTVLGSNRAQLSIAADAHGKKKAIP